VLLLLAATPAPSSAPGTSTCALAVHDLARRTPADAWKPHGEPALFLIARGSTEEEHDGRTISNCAGHEDGVLRWARLLPDQEAAANVVVEAKLLVVNHDRRARNRASSICAWAGRGVVRCCHGMTSDCLWFEPGLAS
jgi:hypothetical protein